MKLLIATLLMAQASVWAQGTLLFYNHVPSVGLNAPVLDTDGLSGVEGGQFQAQLYAGASAASLAPVGFAATFTSSPGYWNSLGLGDSLDRTVPGVNPGDTAYCQVRVWSTRRGSTYDQVAAAGGKHGASDVFSVTTGGVSINNLPPTFPGYLVGLHSFSLSGVDPVPEPTVLALLVIAMAVTPKVRRAERHRSSSAFEAL